MIGLEFVAAVGGVETSSVNYRRESLRSQATIATAAQMSARRRDRDDAEFDDRATSADARRCIVADLSARLFVADRDRNGVADRRQRHARSDWFRTVHEVSVAGSRQLVPIDRFASDFACS